MAVTPPNTIFSKPGAESLSAAPSAETTGAWLQVQHGDEWMSGEVLRKHELSRAGPELRAENLELHCFTSDFDSEAAGPSAPSTSRRLLPVCLQSRLHTPGGLETFAAGGGKFVQQVQEPPERLGGFQALWIQRSS